MEGLFKLENYESLKDSDILGTNLNESAEFDTKDPSVNPTQEFDSNATSAKETNTGVSEKPSAKPVDGTNVSIPGGDKETPSAKPADAASIPVPATTTLTSDEYNSALSLLKKSFKEGYEVLEILESAQVVHKTTEEMQEEYNESVIGDAILQAYEDGPMFEKVDQSDKGDIKKIVRKIRPGIEKALKKDNKYFYKPNVVARIIVGGITAPVGGAASVASALQQIWTTRLWQVLGICHCEDGNIKDICDNLTKEFAEDLGDYKVLYATCVPTVVDAFKNKFHWKNTRNTYFLLVDKKVPSEVKAAIKEFNSEVDKAKCPDGECKDKK